MAYRAGREVERHGLLLRGNPLWWSKTPPGEFFGTAQLAAVPTEVALYSRCTSDEDGEELIRQAVSWPAFEAHAIARANSQINPVDLGAVLVPSDWLLLKAGQSARISAAALSHSADVPRARLRAWFEGGRVIETATPLAKGRRTTHTLTVPLTSHNARSVLHVSVVDGERELWRKEIRTMVVATPPQWPAFGAMETKLRYDAPISVKDPKDGTFSTLDYNTAWDPKFRDVVVFLPNGSRFVFWRGANYIPFWAGPNNTGISYQWAEDFSHPVHHPDGTVDFPEPLYDWELRYGHVRIIESTASRVHVRWTYQSTDIQYRVWGDAVTEDFYFYPDGFGTRVVTLASTPGAAYQLTSFLILTPQAAYPLEVLPSHMADVLFLDGEKQRFTFPLPTVPVGPLPSTQVSNPRRLPMLTRIFAHKDDPAAAIYFYPNEPPANAFFIPPQFDQGQLVAPVYWGGHWPLGRGKITGWTIDDGVYSSPAHNGVGAWLPPRDGADIADIANWEVRPLLSSHLTTLDTLGQSRKMTVNRWAWLIAKTDASDQQLLDWAHSFSDPPSVEVSGARIDFPSFSPERRAVRLIADSRTIQIKLKPVVSVVNPVFEFNNVPAQLATVMVNGVELPADAYAWDGATLWLEARTGEQEMSISLRFL